MEKVALSPSIVRLSWGRVELDDGRSFKDAKLYPGGAREWDWRVTGTRHSPGIQPADLEELLQQGAETIVLSRGFFNRLRICPETLRVLRDRGVETHVVPTGAAAELYNRLRETTRVGALLHSTC